MCVYTRVVNDVCVIIPFVITETEEKTDNKYGIKMNRRPKPK